MKTNVRNAVIVLPIGLALGGCIIDPTHVEDDFGNSVRQMVAAQIYDPEAASNPDPDAPALIDGTAASASVRGYRNDANREERREYRGLVINTEEDD